MELRNRSSRSATSSVFSRPGMGKVKKIRTSNCRTTDVLLLILSSSFSCPFSVTSDSCFYCFTNRSYHVVCHRYYEWDLYCLVRSRFHWKSPRSSGIFLSSFSLLFNLCDPSLGFIHHQSCVYHPLFTSPTFNDEKMAVQRCRSFALVNMQVLSFIVILSSAGCLGDGVLGDRTVRLRFLSLESLVQATGTFSNLREISISPDEFYFPGDDSACHRSNGLFLRPYSHQVGDSAKMKSFSLINVSLDPFSINATHSIVQCTFDIQEISIGWRRYFLQLSFGWNYHTIRFLLSELVPSILVALFNIGIIICIIRTTAHVRRRRQEYHYNHRLSTSMITGLTSKTSPAIPLYDTHPPQPRTPTRRSSFKSLSKPTKSIPFGKMSWMNIVLILHSFLFFLSSSVTSLVYLSTSDMMLAYWMSVVILANCSLNFYIYCLSGGQFRTELKRIAMRCIRHVHKKSKRRWFRQHQRRHSSLRYGKDPFMLQQEFQTPSTRPDRARNCIR